jgi:hypothetical protein
LIWQKALDSTVLMRRFKVHYWIQGTLLDSCCDTQPVGEPTNIGA